MQVKPSVQFGVAAALLAAGIGLPFLTQGHIPARHAALAARAQVQRDNTHDTWGPGPYTSEPEPEGVGYPSAEAKAEVQAAYTPAQHRRIARAAGSLLYWCRERRAVGECIEVARDEFKRCVAERVADRRQPEFCAVYSKDESTCLREVLAREVGDGGHAWQSFSAMYDGAPREARNRAEIQLRMCLEQDGVLK